MHSLASRLRAALLLVVTAACAAGLSAANDASGKAKSDADGVAPIRTTAGFVEGVYKPRATMGGSLAVSNGAFGSSNGKRGASVMREEGMVGEFAVFSNIDAAPKTHAQVRACYGCHQLELETFFFAYDATDWLTFKAGRMTLPLGGVNGRHDQSIRRSISQPLPQIMGNMVRGAEFNQGVIPAPATDNGFAVGGSVDLFGYSWQMNWELFLGKGFSGGGTDLSFVTSRDFEDNNREPAAGGRIELVGDWLTIGASYLKGNYDTDQRLGYDVAMVDFSTQFGRLGIEGLVATRRTEFHDFAGPADNQHHFLKQGYWVQADYQLTDEVAVMASADGLFVSGIALGPGGPTTFAAIALTDKSNSLNRFCAGVVLTPYENVQFKGTFEFWDFSDFRDEVVWQLAAVYTF